MPWVDTDSDSALLVQSGAEAKDAPSLNGFVVRCIKALLLVVDWWCFQKGRERER